MRIFCTVSCWLLLLTQSFAQADQNQVEFVTNLLYQAHSKSLEKISTQKLREAFAGRFVAAIAQDAKYHDLIRMISQFAKSGIVIGNMTKEVRVARAEESEEIPNTKAVTWVFPIPPTMVIDQPDVKAIRWVFYLANKAASGSPPEWVIVDFSKTALKKDSPGLVPGFFVPW